MMKDQGKFVKMLALAAVLCMLTGLMSAAVAEGEQGFIEGDVYVAASGWDECITDAEAEWEQCYIEVSREGIVERIPVETVRVVNFDTTIAMDPEYFTYNVCDGVDTFTYDAWQGEREVYYSVYHIADSSPNQICEELYDTYSEKYGFRNVAAVKVGGYDATTVQFDSENASPTYQRHFFIIPNTDGCIVIEAQFDFEMYEGLYRIMLALFDTLKIG